MNITPANDTFLESFCFRTTSLGWGKDFVAVTILWHALYDPVVASDPR
jgi:hypothetical protein